MVTFAAGLLDATVQAATVLIFAGLGELMTERAGVLNPVVDFLTNPQIMGTYPYLATIIVLTYTVARTQSDRLAVPDALLEPYTREID